MVDISGFGRAPYRAQSREMTEPATTSGVEDSSSVVYIGHLPHGFYESEMLGFFSQFGNLKHVRMSRNKKTGKSKRYAFLEFEHKEVARIAAETMDGYFMFAQKLVCRLLKQDEIHPDLFKGANRTFKNKPWRAIEAERHNKERTPQEHARRVARLIRKDATRRKRIARAGIQYDYPGLQALKPPKAKKIKFSD